MVQRDRNMSSERRHEEVWKLLPWYVNETLDDHERDSVEQHLRGCTRCQEEVARCHKIATTVRRTEDIPASSASEQFSHLMARIDTEQGQSQTEHGRQHKRPSRIAGLSASINRMSWSVRLALAVQSALILLLSGVLVWQASSSSDPLYQTLSNPAQSNPQAVMRMRLIFAEDTMEKEIRTLLLDLGGRIVNGPSPIGAYTVEVSLSSALSELNVKLLHHIRTHPKVTLAEPIQTW